MNHGVMKNAHDCVQQFSPPLTSSPRHLWELNFKSDCRSWICHSAITYALALEWPVIVYAATLPALVAQGLVRWIGRVQHAAIEKASGVGVCSMGLIRSAQAGFGGGWRLIFVRPAAE